MECSSPSVLSSDEQLAIEAIAVELQDPRVTPERRMELLQAINEIADRYACDTRLADY